MDRTELSEPETDGSHMQQQDSVRSQDGTPNVTEDSSEEQDLPKGAYHHLNSKKLNTKQHKRVAQAMDLAVNASAEDTHRMIEGKIREMDRNPLEVQVVVQDLVDKSVIHLVDHEGKFLTVEAIIDDHVPHTQSRSALPCSELGTRNLLSSPNARMIITLTQWLLRAEH